MAPFLSNTAILGSFGQSPSLMAEDDDVVGVVGSENVFCTTVPSMVQQEPRSAEQYFRRGLARYASGDLNGAIEDFTNAIVFNSNIDPDALKRLKRINSSHGKDGRFDP